MVVLLPLLGLTWVFGLMAVNEKSIAFQYIFAILNSLQVLNMPQVDHSCFPRETFMRAIKKNPAEGF
jgi:hypothetical protein